MCITDDIGQVRYLVLNIHEMCTYAYFVAMCESIKRRRVKRAYEKEFKGFATVEMLAARGAARGAAGGAAGAGDADDAV